MSKTTRRSLMAGAATAMAASALPAAATATYTASPRTLELQRLAETARAAVAAEMGAKEGTAEHWRLALSARRAERALDRASHEVWRSPVRTFDDVMARAVIARYDVTETSNGQIFAIEKADDREQRALAELLVGVLALGVTPAVTPTI